MFQGNEEQVVSQKLRGSLDSFHAGSQVTLGLASWTGIGLQGLFQLTIGSRLAFVRIKNSPKPQETVGENPTSTPNFNLGFCIKAVPGPLKSMEVERYHQPQPVSSLELMVRSNRFEGDYLSIIVNSDDVERTTSIN